MKKSVEKKELQQPKKTLSLTIKSLENKAAPCGGGMRIEGGGGSPCAGTGF
jgi:hypothetical protein